MDQTVTIRRAIFKGTNVETYVGRNGSHGTRCEWKPWYAVLLNGCHGMLLGLGDFCPSQNDSMTWVTRWRMMVSLIVVVIKVKIRLFLWRIVSESFPNRQTVVPVVWMRMVVARFGFPPLAVLRLLRFERKVKYSQE